MTALNAFALATGCTIAAACAPSAESLPEAGADAQFAGSYAGSGTYVVLLAGTSADAGQPKGVIGVGVDIDDPSTNPTLASNQVVVHMGGGDGGCALAGTAATTPPYDPYGTHAQPSSAVATAVLGGKSTCTLLVNEGVANLFVVRGDVELHADGSLELSISGPILNWPGEPNPSGEMEFSFIGRR